MDWLRGRLKEPLSQLSVQIDIQELVPGEPFRHPRFLKVRGAGRPIAHGRVAILRRRV